MSESANPMTALSAKPAVSVCFRFDDLSALSDQTLERSVIEVFARFDVPLCVAPIPFVRSPRGEVVPLSRDGASHLIEATRRGVIEIAQHGHSHVHRGPNIDGTRTEFAGLERAEQANLIREGQQLLSAVFERAIKAFVPPWNTYDRTTITVLEEAGFEFVSAGWEVEPASTVPIVPRTCDLRAARSAIERALEFPSLAPLVVVLLHPHDFIEFHTPPLAHEPTSLASLQDVESLLSWIKGRNEIETSWLSAIATSVREGVVLRNPNEANLPFRVKAGLPPMLARASTRNILTGILWRVMRERYASSRRIVSSLSRRLLVLAIVVDSFSCLDPIVGFLTAV